MFSETRFPPKKRGIEETDTSICNLHSGLLSIFDRGFDRLKHRIEMLHHPV